jgi:hypothetical protein
MHTRSFFLYSGYVTSATLYNQLIFLFLAIGIATSFKRVYVGFMQGKRVFATYGDEVAKVMRQVLLISQVGILARDIENARRVDEARLEDKVWENVEEQFDFQPSGSDDEMASKASKGTTRNDNNHVLDPAGGGRDGYNESFNSSQKMKIIELLGAWEDPEHENDLGEIEVRTCCLHQSPSMARMRYMYSFSLFFVAVHSTISPCHQFYSFVSRLLFSMPATSLAIILAPRTLANIAFNLAKKVRLL